MTRPADRPPFPHLTRLLTVIACTLALTLVLIATSRAQVVPGDLQRMGDDVTIHWHGGHGPFVVEAWLPDAGWSAQGDPVIQRSVTLPGAAATGLYRIVDVDAAARHAQPFGMIQTDQGEFGPLLGRHRLKTRFWFYLSQAPPHTSPTFTTEDYFRKLHVVRQYLDDGCVRTWTGNLESLGTMTRPTATRMVIEWADGGGPTTRAFTLTLNFPYSITTARSQAPLTSDPSYTLRCDYARPQPEIDHDGTGLVITRTTTTESTALYQLNPDNPNAPFPIPRKYTVNDRGIEVNLHFLEGVPLLEGSPPFIWKTFILDRWLSPTTASGPTLPAFVTDSWFSRTLMPGHHNFVETVLIEPALDPALSESTRAALLADNIRYLYTFKDLDIGIGSDDIRFIGFDDSLRHP